MVGIFLATGFEEIEAITTGDVLRRGGAEVQLVSVVESKLVTGAHGIQLMTDCQVEDLDFEALEMMVFPGGMPGTTNLMNHANLMDELRKFAGAGGWIAAICAAPMILGEQGLLKGRRATIYPGMEDHLIGAEKSAELVVVDGNIVTSQGPGTAMIFGIQLLDLLKGQKISEKVKGGLLSR